MSITRCQPVLGTYTSLEIADTSGFSYSVMDSVFAELHNIHHELSFQSSTSWISLFNHLKIGEKLYVPDHALRVLKRAIMLCRLSDGLFNPCVATILIKRAILPSHHLTLHDDILPLHLCVYLDKYRFLQKIKPCHIDLSGIAKGYAVDIATIRLRQLGVKCGSVEAGGEIRVFGRGYTKPILVRSFNNSYQHLADIENGAIATSSTKIDLPYGGDIADACKQANALLLKPFNVTVVARSCMIADALTKIVALSQNPCHSVMQLYGAQGWYSA